LSDSGQYRAAVDVGVAAADLADQGRRLEDKFTMPAAPIVGERRARELRSLIGRIDALPSVEPLVGTVAAGVAR
jgi:hypothetical protein